MASNDAIVVKEAVHKAERRAKLYVLGGLGRKLPKTAHRHSRVPGHSLSTAQRLATALDDVAAIRAAAERPFAVARKVAQTLQR